MRWHSLGLEKSIFRIAFYELQCVTFENIGYVVRHSDNHILGFEAPHTNTVEMFLFLY